MLKKNKNSEKLITDEELVSLIQSGNEDAFQKLFKRYQAYAWKLALEFANQNQKSGLVIEELVSIASSAVFIAVTKYNDECESFYPYWRKIARNDLIKHADENSYFRKGSVFYGISLDEEMENYVLSDVIGQIDEGYSSRIFENEMLEAIKNNKSMFSKTELEIGKLLFQNLSIDEIVEKTGYSKSKTYYTVKNFREKLITIIDKYIK